MANKLTKNIPFTVAPNALIQDESISPQARFLYVYMASMPDGWSFFMQPLANKMQMTIKTLRKYTKELEQSGWLTNEGQKVENGNFGANQYTIHFEPVTVGQFLPYGKKGVTQKRRNAKKDLHIKETLVEKKHLNKRKRETAPAKDEIKSDKTPRSNSSGGSQIKTPKEMTAAFGEMITSNEVYRGQVLDTCKELGVSIQDFKGIIREVFSDYPKHDDFGMMQKPRPEQENRFFVKVLSKAEKFIKYKIRSGQASTKKQKVEYLNQV